MLETQAGYGGLLPAIAHCSIQDVINHHGLCLHGPACPPLPNKVSDGSCEAEGSGNMVGGPVHNMDLSLPWAVHCCLP